MPRGIPGSGPKAKPESFGTVDTINAVMIADPLAIYGDPASWIPKVGQNIKFALEQHSKAYVERPSATNFGKLEDSMYAWQFWVDSDEERRLAITKHLLPLGVGHWDAEVRRLQLADFNDKRQGL